MCSIDMRAKNSVTVGFALRAIVQTEALRAIAEELNPAPIFVLMVKLSAVWGDPIDESRYSHPSAPHETSA